MQLTRVWSITKAIASALMMYYSALMGMGPNDLSIAVGSRVKGERKKLGWTLDELAEKAAISRRMLIKIEQGATNPSIGMLLKLSETLAVGLPDLVAPPVTTQPHITRAGTGATLWTGQHGGEGILLAGTGAPHVVELWDWTLGPQDFHHSDAHTVGTRELLHVLQGSVTIEVPSQTHVLNAGDAISFYSDVAHSYSNPNTTLAHFTLCVYEPEAKRTYRNETKP